MEKINKIEEYKKFNVKINNTFKEYYKNNLQMNPNEFEEFYVTSSKKLPTVFRVNKIYNYCEFLDCELQKIIHNLELEQEIQKFNWNNMDNIYELISLDKIKHKELKSLLIKENDLGILRQELVSMIPVSLVDIQEDSVVIDMCAAPGNKSVQILEIMQEKAREKNIMATGVLISNELDYKRAEKLVHLLQTQPTVNVISTLCPAQEFPKISNVDFQPDFVFCDVPCSGDGTLRKNKGLRKRWRPDYGFKNHVIQIEILENSIRLCKVGGMVIYSTCSVNPIENEAVVAHILEKYNNLVELVDLTDKIKNGLKIKFSEGLVKWKVAYDWSDNQNIHFAYDYSQVGKNKHLIKESMFHEIYTKKNHQNNIYFSDPLNIRRCVRFYSHQNNSGSFFVAVFKKKSELTDKDKIVSNSNMNFGNSTPLNKNEFKMKTINDELEEIMEYLGVEDWVDKNCNENNNENNKDNLFLTSTATSLPPNQNLPQNINESESLRFDKYVKFKDYEENYKILKEFYNFTNEDILLEQLHTLRTTSSKILLFSKKLSEVVKILCEMNLNIMHAGLVCFLKERTNLTGKYRLTHYGGIILEKMIQNQKLDLENNEENQKLFFDLLFVKKIKFDKILPNSLREQILLFKMGSLIIIYDSIIVVCRKGNNNLSVMIPEIQLENLANYVNKYVK